MEPHEHIRLARLAAGLTQEQAAKRAKIHRTNWVRLEAGRHRPGEKMLARVAKALGLPAGELEAGKHCPGKKMLARGG